MRAVVDIEANGLLPTVTEIFCICIDINGKIFEFDPDHIDTALDILKDADTLIGHNFIGYDLPALKKVLGWDYHGRVIDTMILSQITHQERTGGHGLDAWGERLGYPKVQHEDWTQYSTEMLKRCTQDVVITGKVLQEFEQGGEIVGTRYQYTEQDISM